jgi:hypothetical protein
MNKTDLMLDLETLDTKPGGTILAIGAVLFDRDADLDCDKGAFYMEINIASQLLVHATVSADVLDWWERTDREWIESAMSDEYQKGLSPIDEVLKAFDKWMLSHYERPGFELSAVWAQGQDFDFSILGEMYRRVRVGKANNTMPWPFWCHRDTRTAYDVTNFDPSTVQRAGKHHNALADCHHQIKCLQAALRGTANG